MTREEAEVARTVWLAAVREAGFSVPDGFVWAAEDHPSGGWQLHGLNAGLPIETIHKAMTLSARAVGAPVTCLECWKAGRGHACAEGDCRSEEIING